MSAQINICMRLSELEKPKSAEQLKLDQLRANREKATNAVRQERELLQTQHAQQALKKLQKPKPSTLKTVKPVGTIKPISTIKPA